MNAIELLLIEDNPADVMLVKEALKECPNRVRLTIATDGEKACSLLEHEGLKPDVIILDLNIPKVGGLSLLERCNRTDARVVVFSSSAAPKELERAAKLGVAECLTKPADLTEFLSTIWGIIDKWAIK